MTITVEHDAPEAAITASVTLDITTSREYDHRGVGYDEEHIDVAHVEIDEAINEDCEPVEVDVSKYWELLGGKAVDEFYRNRGKYE